jgi:hypothetical protein
VTDADLWRLDFAEKKREDGSRARKQLDFHDLRGGFVTWALATGRTEAWVTDRTGHTSSVMLYRYKRRVRHAEELTVQPPGSLLDAIPELRELGGGSPGNGSKTGGQSNGEPDRSSGSTESGGSTENERSASSEMPKWRNGRRGGFKSPCPENPAISADSEPVDRPNDDVDEALAYALRGATDAGQWAAVTAIANALGARCGR